MPLRRRAHPLPHWSSACQPVHHLCSRLLLIPRIATLKRRHSASASELYGWVSTSRATRCQQWKAFPKSSSLLIHKNRRMRVCFSTHVARASTTRQLFRLWTIAPGIFAKLPNPMAGPSSHTTTSEVATSELACTSATQAKLSKTDVDVISFKAH